MIKVKNLSKDFPRQKVLTDIDFTAKDGRRVLILGKSGSGKSVFLKCILGLLVPDTGYVEIDGTDVSALMAKPRLKRKLTRVRQNIGYVFQGSALLDSLTVEENIDLALEFKRLKKSERDRIINEKLKLVGLSSKVRRKYPQQLSGGMKKMVAIARAIASEPKYIFYDEPTTGLDPAMVVRITKLIIELSERLDITSLIVTHDMGLARRAGQDVYFLKNYTLSRTKKSTRLEELYE
ncbi:ATP-binding cassette domain-containing protein [candidate division WOR-3 bacterium]|uniref:ATP-binding cassette domain-containing protein n=1 Tax=candidate division WOR-3 bacterium TaxID=2052148 RepID=A0A9D5QDC5_UNCW3|nr:ATP-binding cassette domain-containing protein [candidate division WOR-3 bacterium]MBD3364916.1 ATP-binding cassette domain-containing protein [candidate division WOR-3 bacterium]